MLAPFELFLCINHLDELYQESMVHPDKKTKPNASCIKKYRYSRDNFDDPFDLLSGKELRQTNVHNGISTTWELIQGERLT